MCVVFSDCWALSTLQLLSYDGPPCESGTGERGRERGGGERAREEGVRLQDGERGWEGWGSGWHAKTT